MQSCEQEPNSNAMIEIKSLTKKFGSFKALDNVSFSAQEGEIITLLGPNGAGKSTLMRCLCGYYLPDGGEINVEGEKLNENLLSSLRKFGYMPENTPLYNEMKVLEYLRFVGGIYKMSAENFADRLDLVVKKLDLSSVLKQKIGTLSKGYRRRVGIASVILHQPKILVLDEPTEGLDPNQKVTLRAFLKEYASTALVIISTHLLEEADALSSRVLIMNHGVLIRDTTINALKNEALNGDLSQLFYRLTTEESSHA